jgi:formate dehydrogenase subunit gamma
MSTNTTALTEGAVTASGEIVRYTYKERLCHWTNGVTYLFCLCTGLAFYSPYLYWLSVVGGGPATARMLHPWAGVFFYLSVVWMHTMWKQQMASIPEDQQWKDKIKDYVENNDAALPPQGRFNAGQKLFYWVMYYGALVLLASGILMWFPEKWRGLHGLMSIVTPLHTVAALATIAAFIIHIYMGILMVTGGLSGITRGTVSKEWAAHHHRLWYDKIKQSNR